MLQGKLPWVMHAAALSQALPILAALRFGVRLPQPRLWVALWFVTLLLNDAFMLWERGRGNHNLWLLPIFVPVQNAIMLWTLSLWQDDPVSRLAFRLMIPLSMLAMLALLPVTESMSAFNQFISPFQALVLLAASLFTLVTRSSAEPDRVSQRDWFWVSLGLSLFFAIRVTIPPFAQYTVHDHPDLARLAYNLMAWTDIAANVLIARGLLCPPPQMRFGGSS